MATQSGTQLAGTQRAGTHTLQVAGATLVYDVRPVQSGAVAGAGAGAGAGLAVEPVLLLIGSPMGAAGFVTLGSHFKDRTVVTYDPRGSERSEKTDPASPSTPDEHADDLHQLIQVLGAGAVDLFATSGGAVNALALVAHYPEQVRTLVAHEPPLLGLLPDREAALAAARDTYATYQRSGFGAGMAKFIVLVQHKGPFSGDWADQPAPDPGMFGLPTADDGSRTDVLLGQNLISSTGYAPDFDALRRASTRVVIAAGVDSAAEPASRGAHAAAEQLGTGVVVFPSHHAGFLGGEYGQTGEPDAFAARLREVLGERTRAG